MPQKRPFHLLAGAAPLDVVPGERALRLFGAAGSLLFGIAARALARAKKRWLRLPRSIRRRVYGASKWTGLPFFLSYVASYEETHQLRNFAGNLVSLKENYLSSSGDQREKLAQQFDAIVDSLVMRNGVKKTNRPMRQHDILAKVLADEQCRPQQSAIKVLDVPASTGIAALDSFTMLSKYYGIRGYVLGDLFFHIYYDTERECIFDEEFTLLQVKLKKRFFSIYRPYRSGDMYSHLTQVLLFPINLVSRYLKKKYLPSETSNMVPIPVIHPEVEARLRNGDLSVTTVDVFKPIADKYDLILSFNLLVSDYFPPDQIASGIENLKHALNEQGFLITGDDVSFSVAQKRAGKLVVVKRDSSRPASASPP